MTRTDVHRPSVMNPADYEWKGCYPPMMANLDNLAQWWTPCEHCGARFIWGDVWTHVPTGDEILVGHICSIHYFECPDRAVLEFNKHKRAIMAMRAQAKEKASALARNPQACEYMDELWEQAQECYRRADEVDDGTTGDEYRRVYKELFPQLMNFDFIRDMVARWAAGKPLSDKQLEAVVRVVEKDKTRQARITALRAERAALLQDSPVLAEGRQPVEARIVSVKVYTDDGYMGGDSYKMLVELDNGNRLWGSVPVAVQEHGSNLAADAGKGWSDWTNFIVGLRISFAAQVAPKEEDPHFGYYKRPTKVQVIEQEVPAQA